MTVSAKICGLNTQESVAAAVSGGADFIGFVFYPPSPRYVPPEQAAALIRTLPSSVTSVGLFADASDDVISESLKSVRLDMLQLHGNESPDRVRELREMFGRKTMKAIKVETAADVEAACAYDDSADWLLFDAKPPKASDWFLDNSHVSPSHPPPNSQFILLSPSHPPPPFLEVFPTSTQG